MYTTNEPCMAKTTEYKGLGMVSKVKTRNMFSDIKVGVVATKYF